MRLPPRLAIVVPALNEAATLPLLLGDLAALALPHEVVVADGGSTDGTRDLARRAGARVIEAPRGRGAQLATGARATAGEVLCFLHADVRLSPRAVEALEAEASGAMDAAWAFSLRIDAAGAGYRVIEAGANLRSRALRLPYGDQGLLVSRALYERAGGFLALPLMEDVTLVRAIARHAPVRMLAASVRVSPRRWQREGLLEATLRNWSLLAAWGIGVAPVRLARWYRTEPRAPAHD